MLPSNELYSYFRAMLTQAQAETSQAREELTKQNQQLAQANSLNSELRRAIAMRDGCLEHANSVITQLQEHKFHLYSIIDNFRAQQASSKSQIDLQARSLISKERHIFSLSENIERLQAESTNHQKSCEEALQFMLQECQAASRERDAALREVVSLRHQITHSKSLKSGSTGLGSASRKAMIASLDVGPRPEPFVNSMSSTITAHAVTAVTHTDSNACKDAHNTVSPVRDHAVYFYLAHSHKKQPYAAMYGTQTSPAVVDGTHSPDFSKRKLLMDLFGDESSLGSSRKVPESGHSEGVESIALEQEIAKHNLLVTRSSLTGSSGSTPTANQSLSASNSNSLVAGSSTGKESRVFTNQQRRRSAARSLASKCLIPCDLPHSSVRSLPVCTNVLIFRHFSCLSARERRSQSSFHSPTVSVVHVAQQLSLLRVKCLILSFFRGSAHAIETIGTMENVRLWAALMAADADTSDS